MRLVVLSSCGAFDRYLIGRLSAAVGPFPVCRVRWEALAPPPGESRPARWLRRLEERLYLDRAAARIETRVGQLLGDPPCPPLAAEVSNREVNAPPTVAALRALEPDLLLVSAGPLLKPAVFQTPRWGAINVHRGISTAYRGEDSAFWALLQGDFAQIGLTLHWIDAGVDTGRALAEYYPPLASDDDEPAVLAKLARGAAELLIELLVEVRERGQPPAGMALDLSRSRNFRTRERRLGAVLRGTLARRLAGRRPPVTAERVVRYFADEGLLTSRPDGPG